MGCGVEKALLEVMGGNLTGAPRPVIIRPFLDLKAHGQPHYQRLKYFAVNPK
jgi:hypothetical protein